LTPDDPARAMSTPTPSDSFSAIELGGWAIGLAIAGDREFGSAFLQ